VLASGGVDADSALVDLVEVSRDIRAALLLDRDGNILASTFDDGPAAAFAAAVHALVSAAEAAKPGDVGALARLRAELRDGCVFVVADDDLLAAATTDAKPAAALVVHDLEACLHTLTGVEADAPA
jgi:predicted regulator of Ras-like GTPase activity (Roadblock/LC7/MglB family)